MGCEWGVCTKVKRWKKGLQIDTPEKEAFFNEMLSEWETEATDASYYRAILDGSWPNAVELLERALERAELNTV